MESNAAAHVFDPREYFDPAILGPCDRTLALAAFRERRELDASVDRGPDWPVIARKVLIVLKDLDRGIDLVGDDGGMSAGHKAGVLKDLGRDAGGRERAAGFEHQ